MATKTGNVTIDDKAKAKLAKKSYIYKDENGSLLIDTRDTQRVKATKTNPFYPEGTEVDVHPDSADDGVVKGFYEIIGEIQRGKDRK